MLLLLLLCCFLHVWFCVIPWTIACKALLLMGILQTKIMEWVAMLSSGASSQPRDQNQVFHFAGSFFTVWVSRWLLNFFFFFFSVNLLECLENRMYWVNMSLVTNITFNKYYVENYSVNLMFNFNSSVEHSYYYTIFNG